MRFINNNDTGVRFVDQYGVGMTRVAAVLQFTLPGIPAMFAGDEIGASYEPYSNLTPIPWKDKHHLRPLYERLIQLKHDTPSLNGHGVELLETTADSAVAYVRPATGGGAPVLVLLNFGPKQPHFEITPTPGLMQAIGGGSMRDLLTDDPVHLTVGANAVSFPMGATSAFVLVPESS
jgi:cyclomaltodextrinase / maltogenic alpha-amylase / neopullulanase